MLSYPDIKLGSMHGCNLMNPHIMIFDTLLSLSHILTKNYSMCVCVMLLRVLPFYLKVVKTIN